MYSYVYKKSTSNNSERLIKRPTRLEFKYRYDNCIAYLGVEDAA